MKNATRGLLLSGLLFPGLGQVALGRKVRGIAIMVVVLLAALGIAVKAWMEAWSVVMVMVEETGTIDITAISDVAHQCITRSDSALCSGLVLFVIVCWIASAVDAFAVGSRLDRETGGTGTDAAPRGRG